MSVSIGPGSTTLTVMPRAQIARKPAGQVGDGAFRHRVDRYARKGDALAQATSDRDQPAAIFHVLDCSLHGDDRCSHVDIPDPIQVGDRHFFERAGRKYAGVVDQNIEPAKFGGRFIDCGGDCRGIGAVGLDGKAASACRP